MLPEKREVAQEFSDLKIRRSRMRCPGFLGETQKIEPHTLLVNSAEVANNRARARIRAGRDERGQLSCGERKMRSCGEMKVLRLPKLVTLYRATLHSLTSQETNKRGMYFSFSRVSCAF